MDDHTRAPTSASDLSPRTSPPVEVLDGPLYTRDQLCRTALHVGALCAVVGIAVGYWLGRAEPGPEVPR